MSDDRVDFRKRTSNSLNFPILCDGRTEDGQILKLEIEHEIFIVNMFLSLENIL